ncbi:hypothetical protein SKTS_33470 [Sulfurimicrobium lacus]|uniref:Uncharacterized protein n=1 Tax=Sulfurimicrobium lacus TaxID=2715678 RepID=A0A6F8VH18_9PROT|nr:NusG domain II-containing protein [Sulfurimicrobium lacus]BCB28461.1 hypothetical protein SKTS_33470 [Sulfurimicrobium lacus]
MSTHLKPGDWIIALAGISLVAGLFSTLWGTAAGTTLIIRSGGKVVAQADLARNHDFEIAGPLGITVVSVENRRVRVARDPSPRQYCVKQGWLSHAGEAALCLPNQVSVELAGAIKRYDSLSY